MHNANTNTAGRTTPTRQSSRTLLPADVTIARSLLQRANRLDGTETDAEISAKYFQMRDDNANRAQIEADKRQAEMRQMLTKRMRESIRSAGIDPTGLNEQEIEQRFQEVEADRTERERKRRQLEQHRQLRIKAEQLFNAAKCPVRHVEHMDRVTAGPKQWTDLLETLSGQLKYSKGFLIALLGPRGLGKTQLCVNLIHRACGIGLSARYAKTAEIHLSVRATYADGQRESEAQVIAKWCKFHLLVMDEFADRPATEAENKLITSIADARYDAGLMTVLISNQTPEEFAVLAGHSISSRMIETGGSIVCDWPSFRKPGNWKADDNCPIRKEVDPNFGVDREDY